MIFFVIFAKSYDSCRLVIVKEKIIDALDIAVQNPLDHIAKKN